MRQGHFPLFGPDLKPTSCATSSNPFIAAIFLFGNRTNGGTSAGILPSELQSPAVVEVTAHPCRTFGLCKVPAVSQGVGK